MKRFRISFQFDVFTPQASPSLHREHILAGELAQDSPEANSNSQTKPHLTPQLTGPTIQDIRIQEKCVDVQVSARKHAPTFRYLPEPNQDRICVFAVTLRK
jgi:hypothetical protein